jgi:hypothetical protein
LMKRVTRAGRKRHHKITKRKHLQEMLDRYDLWSQVPDRKSLSIDNTRLSATKTAKTIVDHFHLCG